MTSSSDINIIKKNTEVAKAGSISNNLYKLPKKELDIAIKKIKIILNKQPKTGVSFNHNNYQIVNNHFPKRQKYVWNLVRFINLGILNSRKILKDETVKIVLVNFKPI